MAANIAIESKTEELSVPEQLTKWRIFGVDIRGVTPLLMNNPAKMRGASGKSLDKKEIPTPENEALSGRYVNDAGLYVKSDALRQSMINGSSGLKINKKAANVILSAAVMELPDALEFTLFRDGSPISPTEYEIDVRRCVVQRQGVLRARPRIDLPWSFTGRFLVDTAVVGGKAEPVISALARAGQIVGLLDYRPAKKGSFGRFEVLRAWFEN